MKFAKYEIAFTVLTGKRTLKELPNHCKTGVFLLTAL